jgi:molybdopterin converting factor small subunit
MNHTIKIRVAGVFGGAPTNELLEEPFVKGDTPASVLGRVDKRKAFGRKFFGKLLKNGGAVLLLNGERLEHSEMKKKELKEGDEISVLSAIAGG